MDERRPCLVGQDFVLNPSGTNYQLHSGWTEKGADALGTESILNAQDSVVKSIWQ